MSTKLERVCPRPFLKWAGGKTQLLAQYRFLLPAFFEAYHEPFLGGGALFFFLAGAGRIRTATLSDVNPELINVYTVVRDKVEPLIRSVRNLRLRATADDYYAIRRSYPLTRDPVERAARLIYLNKTCYNGLYRVNRQGRFNVPYGRYSNPSILHEEGIRAASAALQGTTLQTADFGWVQDRAQRREFVYLDPPYHPLSATASFTEYAGSFGECEQRRLAEVFRALHHRGCWVMLSNSDTPLVKSLYKDFTVTEVEASRAISCKGDGRGRIKELVITNYEPQTARKEGVAPLGEDLAPRQLQLV